MAKPTLVGSQDEAAAVLVSPASIMPWSQVADAMQPNFALTGDQAAQQVLPATERISEQVLSAFGASLGIGTPDIVKAVPKTTAPAAESGSDDKPATSESSTGSASKDSTKTSTATPVSSTELGLDPILRYQTGLALFETVQMLNREVQSAAVLSNAVPFVARLKVAVLPYRPNLAYSLHLRVAFFPNRRCGSGSTPARSPATGATPQTAQTNASVEKEACTSWYPASTRPPQVIPILAADDIERALKSRAVDVAQQIGIALAAVSHGVGANAAVNNANRAVTAISGQDLNSRLTVARQSDNTLYVRIGATDQATAGAALVGQTYDIAVLLLVPREYFDDPNSQGRKVDPQIRIVTHTQFRNAATGDLLPDRPVPVLVAQFDRVMREVLPATNDPQYAAWSRLSALDKEAVARAFAAPIQKSNYDQYTQLFQGPIGGTSFSLQSAECKDADSNGFQSLACNDEYWKRQNFWTAATTILADTAMKSAFFELHWPEKVRIPHQTALILDDTKEKAVVQLWDVGGQSAAALGAKLDLVPKGHATPVSTLAAQSLVLDPTTHTLTLTFASAVKWGIPAIDPAATQNKLTIEELECSSESLCPGLRYDPEGADQASLDFPVLLASAASDGKSESKPNVSVAAAVTQIVAVRGVGSIVITVDKLKDDSITLAVSGADVVSALDSSGKNLPVTAQGLVLKAAGTVTYRLTNLHVGTPVVISAEGKKGKATTGKITLSFPVVTSR